MRIVFLNPSGQLGGAERVLLDVLATLRIAQPEWELVVILAEDGPLAQQTRDLDVRTVVFEFRPALARVGE